jgi:hypothetical protein
VAEEKKPSEKTLEMRVAAIEDILAKLHITEEEMRTYEKVSNLLASNPARGGHPPAPPGNYPPHTLCYFPQPLADYPPRNACHFRRPPCSFPRPACGYECFCGPCSSYGGGEFGGGFGGFGF